MRDLPPLSAVLKKYDLAPKKSLGQNFLFDLNLTDRIVRYAGDLAGCSVIEIGPGPGGLTRSILNGGAEKLIVIEQDERCIAALEDIAAAAGGRLQIINADALTIKERELTASPIKIIANLPYNIATVLLFKWLEYVGDVESMTLMFQKEVADRIMAKPRTKAYGRVSVMTQWQCEVEHNFDISPKAFIPPPKVTSSVITITPRKQVLAPADKQVLETLCRIAFGQRRKTLRSSLRQLTSEPEKLLEEAAIQPEKRPEELSVEEFCALARGLEKYMSNPKSA
jgi:16S rRNA (adenine1518-N6/adenine1519-N6)-dimethyltransferase